MLRVVAYDVSSPRRLRRVARICLDYGIRIEKSVFECDLRTDQFEEMWQRLENVVDQETDYLVAYPVCATCESKIITFGQSRHLEPAEIRVF